MPFVVSAPLFAVLLAAGAYTIGCATVRTPDLHRTLPRARLPGEIIGLVCLVWSAYHVCAMLEGDLEKFRILVRLLAPVVAILGYYHLDYLFTRALGGFVLLAVNHLLHGAFVARIAMRPAFSVICYAIAMAALLLVASPWWFRDLLEKTAESATWRRAWTAGLGAASVAFVVFAFAR